MDNSVERFIDLAIALTSETELDRIFDRILIEAMRLTNCDAGTVYVKKEDALYFESLYTNSKGVHMSVLSEDVSLPPVPLDNHHVCACSALEKRLINIPDIYDCEGYDFSGAKKYDKINDYRTQSMLVLPMIDDTDSVIGVLQLINAMDSETGQVIPFSKDFEKSIFGLTSLASVCLHNRMLADQIREILHSFVRVMVGAIEKSSSYNANHTKSMVKYGRKLLTYMSGMDDDHATLVPEEEWDAFLMSIWLHDIGKILIPHSVMDKPSRLGDKTQDVMYRIDMACMAERLAAYEAGNPDDPDAGNRISDLQEAREFINSINGGMVLSDDMIAHVHEIAKLPCRKADGSTEPLLSEDEEGMLAIRSGTLTVEERNMMQRHVEYTASMLAEMSFRGEYAGVPEWASSHHELLDGSGYPRHIAGDEIPPETRLLTILDVYDALTGEDRPYKPPLSPEKAFEILGRMADEGKVDRDLLDVFIKSNAWKKG